MDIESEILEHERRITKVETCIEGVVERLARIEGSASATEVMIRYVVLPLLIIVGGLVGIKLFAP